MEVHIALELTLLLAVLNGLKAVVHNVLSEANVVLGKRHAEESLRFAAALFGRLFEELQRLIEVARFQHFFAVLHELDRLGARRILIKDVRLGTDVTDDKSVFRLCKVELCSAIFAFHIVSLR